MSNPESILAELGIELPSPPTPAANYVPYVRSGNMLYVSGQVSATEDGVVVGTLGQDMTTDDGAAAAMTCGIFLLAQVKKATGDLSKVRRVVKLTGFVASAPSFTSQPKVVNGASDLMVAVFGDAGRHARSAVGVAALPLGAAVEVEGIFELAE